MKNQSLLFLSCYVAACLNPLSTHAADETLRPLFNGKDLEGWDGNPELWSVENGVITGKTTGPDQLAYNQFLIWRGGEVKNFILHAKIKVRGNNSGIQYRSRELPQNGKWSVGGYQCDVHPKTENNAMVYDEKGRGVIVRNGQDVVVTPEGRKWLVAERDPVEADVAEWNEYTIIARGNRLIHRINGKTTVNLLDHDEKARSLAGLIAFQLHRGPAMTIHIKDVKFRELPASPIISYAKNNIPADARLIEKRGAKGKGKAKPVKPAPKRASATPSADPFKWISEAPKPKWIWRIGKIDNEPIFLRKTFDVPAEFTSAKIYFTCDNRADVHLNGKKIGTSTDWGSPIIILNAAKLLKAGQVNTLAVRAQNRGGTAAFVFKLEITEPKGKKAVISDLSWKLSTKEPDGWKQITFDDSGWDKKLRSMGDLGTLPWRIPGLSGGGQNTSIPVATPVDRIKVAEGFSVELIYSVPGTEQGSWVALCSDDNGRMYASDQYGGLYQFTLPAPGKTLQPEDVKKVPVDIRAINGMAFVDGAIYAGVNDYEQKIPSGFYRISDSDGDGDLDKAELLREFTGRGDHGVHAVVPTADGKYFYLITGNNVEIGGGFIEGTPDSSPVPKVWGDDHLLPGLNPRRGRLAPGGVIYRISRDGKKFELYASGFRNIYGGSLNKHGELFTYDADMEHDMNTPWYRPTRVNHVVSGGEYGWRLDAGKFPEFYPDTVPATLNVGAGSPTGTRFGYGAKFPAKYQRAYYILDWSWGKIYAVHLEEEGSSYSATKEEFITGAPLPATDLLIHPNDGAMYFAIGGRRVQSGLYRVTYQGKGSTAPIDLSARKTPLRKLRHQLESFHGKASPKAVKVAWPHLDHQDRFIRSAARVALEHQSTEHWSNKALTEKKPGRRLAALLALARVKGVAPKQRPQTGHVIDTATRDQILTSLLEVDLTALNHFGKLTYVRLVQITLIRFGDPDTGMKERLISALDPVFPADTFELNWLLCETLAHLQAPNTAAKGMALIAAAKGQEPQMEYARSLRFLKTGWTPELREQQLQWFLKAANYRGGAHMAKFIEFIRTQSLTSFTTAEKKQHAELIAKKPENKTAIENFGSIFAGRTPKNWTLEELSAAADKGMKNRDFENGRKMFSGAACFACHRFGDAGGITGPDLTGSGGRYSPHDFLDQIINPSKVISDQFAPIVVTKNDGETITGVIVNLGGTGVVLNTDLSDPNQHIRVDRKQVKSIELSKVSPMPPMLLMMLKEDEILDLVAYVLSGGDKSNEMFKK